MIAFGQPESEQPATNGTGEGGGPYLTKTQQNNIVKSILSRRRRWKLTPEAKRHAIAVTMANLEDEDGRVRNTAVANLLKMEGQNQLDQHKAVDKRLPDLLAVGGTVEHRLTAQELLTQPDYVEWLRERERDSDPRLISTNGHAGNGKPVDDGPSRNGH